ncbi:MAG: hypothetical protein WD009_12490 [Phycisphaeraceae bacterium]
MTKYSNIGLLAATQPELAAVVRRLDLQWQGSVAFGTCGEHTILATVSGIGRRRAVEGVANLFKIERFDLLVDVGFAGALDPELTVGQVIEFAEVMNEAGDRLPLHCDGEPGGGRTLLTVNRVVDSLDQKQALREQHHASAVDMETFHVAHSLRRRRVPLRSIRAIFDTADMAPPAAAQHWVTPEGLPRTLPATVWLMAHPTRLPVLRRLRQCTRLAANALADELERMLVEEPV